MYELSLQKLMELVSFDQQTVALQKKRDSQQLELVQSEQRLHDFHDTLQKQHTILLEARRTVHQKEQEMAVLEGQEKEIKRKLDTVSNHREYESLTKEIERIKQAQEQLEPILLDVWKELEIQQEQHRKVEQGRSAIEENMQKSIDQQKAQIAETQKLYDDQRAQRAGYITSINPEMLERYEALYQQVSNPVVPVIDGSCSACFYAVTHHEMAQMRKRKLLQCKDCFRLLYVPDSIDT